MKKTPGPPPDFLSPEDEKRLWAVLEHNVPWLVEDNSDSWQHCHPAWVEGKVRECLSYFAGKGIERADWVMTCCNWVYKADGWAWDALSTPQPSARLWLKMREVK